MLDSHCHLADEAFEADLESVVERARAAGLRTALCIVGADQVAERERARQVQRLWPEAGFAVGIHPHQAGGYAGRGAAVERQVRDAIEAMPSVRAVGEIGLDYHYDFAPRDLQREVFRRQVRFAREAGFPVVIHTREANADTLAILREEGGGEVAGVFHCFTGGAALADQALDLGFHLSFSGIVTFPRAGALREVAARVPADRLLVETDAPYLAPVPYRGKRNEPAWVARVLDAVATVRGVTPEALGESVDAGFGALVAGAGGTRPGKIVTR